YTAQLLWFLPPSLVSPAAILATGAEVIVAGGVLVGGGGPLGAISAGGVLVPFSLALTFAPGVEAAAPTSPLTAAAAAFLLGVVALREHGTEGTRKFDAEARKPEQYAQARVTQKGAS